MGTRDGVTSGERLGLTEGVRRGWTSGDGKIGALSCDLIPVDLVTDKPRRVASEAALMATTSKVDPDRRQAVAELLDANRTSGDADDVELHA